MNRRDFLLNTGIASSALALPVHASPINTRPLATRPIPASGELLPVIGLGTWQNFDVGATAAARAPLREVLTAFNARGGLMIDSSPMYGRSEEVAGDLMRDVAGVEKFFVATKVWTRGEADGVAQMAASARKLRKPTMDLMQVHNLVDIDTHWPVLVRMKAEKRVRYIGITHYTESAYRDVARVIEADKERRIDFLQINYSVVEHAAERRLLPLAKERGIAVIVNRPFAGGELVRRLSDKPLPAFAADVGAKTWAQLLLKFVIAHPAVTVAIPATSKVKHLHDNLDAGAAGVRALSQTERGAVQRLAAGD